MTKMTDIALDAEGEIVLEYADMTLVEGKDCLLQDIKTRLMTDIGALFYDTAFGSGVLRYIQAPADELTLLELKAAVKDALETEPRIDNNSVAVKVSADKEGILSAQISFMIAENGGAVNLVLSLDGKITLYEV